MPHDVLGDRTVRHVASGRGSLVTPAIPALRIPARVMLLAVALHDEPPIDEEVDPSYAIDQDLRLDRASDRAQDQAHQRLGPGFRARIEQTSHPPMAAWQRTEQVVEF